MTISRDFKSDDFHLIIFITKITWQRKHICGMFKKVKHPIFTNLEKCSSFFL